MPAVDNTALGSAGFKPTKTKYATIGVLICWDQWFPEGARAMALQGAEVGLLSSSVHSGDSTAVAAGEQNWIQIRNKPAKQLQLRRCTRPDIVMKLSH